MKGFIFRFQIRNFETFQLFAGQWQKIQFAEQLSEKFLDFRIKIMIIKFIANKMPLRQETI